MFCDIIKIDPESLLMMIGTRDSITPAITILTGKDVLLIGSVEALVEEMTPVGMVGDAAAGSLGGQD